jgi:flagellar biogenesis protein FliO
MARMQSVTTRFTLTLLTVAACTASPGQAQDRTGGQPEAERCVSLRLPLTLIESGADGEPCVAPRPGTLTLSARTAAAPAARTASPTAGRAALTTLTSLAVVVGLFLLLVWLQRRTGAGRGLTLPGEVLETLGRVRLNGRQEMHLVRVGNKLLLLAVTAQGAETLTEITDPREIDRLSGICRHSRPDSISASFREILTQLASPQPGSGAHCPAGR